MARGGQHNNDDRFQPLTSPTSGSTATQSDQSFMENTNNPFFIHSGDHPGLVLVSHLLTGSNYNTWSRAMLMALNAKNKPRFVDGILSQPMTDNPTVGIRSRCNNMVTSYFLNAISKEIADSLLYLESAHAIWADLHERFHQSNAPRIFQIKQQLHGLSQGSLNVNTYYTQLKILWDELKNYQPIPVYHCGGMKAWMDYQLQEYMMQFLMGLNESYASTRGQILMLDPFPPVAKVFNLVVQEECQWSIGSRSSAPSDSMTFNASSQLFL
ncbi:uncharacterized protein LOC109124173 [Vitis vinifera]|nr:uncharacterized protein LOC109124173 [Vitis vinifera]|eukprot:XP_019081495.1 PREDICTED: uncharacterized protein LOC109124173 [Vitis vinifera]